jgi:hypothetical protein
MLDTFLMIGAIVLGAVIAFIVYCFKGGKNKC